MRKKSLLISFIICMISCVCFISNYKVSVASSAKYDMEKEKETYKDGDTVRGVVYYQYPQLKGKSSAVTKINKVLKSAADDFMASENANSIEDYVSGAIDSDGFYSDTEQYYYKTSCKVTYNKKNVISIHMKEMWYAGGVYNQKDYGYTFDLKTGKKLSVVNVISGNASTVKSKIVKAETKYLKNLLGTSDLDENYPNVIPILKNYKLANYNYYLTPAKAHICFQSYELELGNGWNVFSVVSKYK